jgi:hypothetical protein
MVPQLPATGLDAVGIGYNDTIADSGVRMGSSGKEVIVWNLLRFSRPLDRRTWIYDGKCLDAGMSLHRASRPVNRMWP